MVLALGHAAHRQRVVATNHIAALTPHHCQGHLKLPRRGRACVRDTAVDADFGSRIEAQAYPLLHVFQAMLEVGFQAVGVKMPEQLFAGEIIPCAGSVAECFAPAQRAACRCNAVDEAKALGGAQQPLIGAGQHR
ncbi:hypothetical protein D3C81_1458690 [compost metagenome]